MNAYKNLSNNIRRYVQLSEAEEQELISIIQIRRLKKRQFLIQPGFVCQHRFYIVEGAMRVYYLDDDGKEHTISIAVEDWFVSDFYSYITQTPATLYGEALEDCIIFQMEYEAIEGLCANIHALSEYFRLSTEKAFAYARRRVISNISKTAEERYFEYLEQYPHIANRVPQYVLASYLGISAEFLSKIRSKQSRKS